MIRLVNITMGYWDQIIDLFYIVHYLQLSLRATKDSLDMEEDVHKLIIPGLYKSSDERFKERRSHEEIISMIDSYQDRDIYCNALSSGIQIMETFFLNLLALVINAHPQKLSIGEKNIPINVVTSSESIEDIYERVIHHHLQAVFYGSPRKYFIYIEEVLSIKLNDELKVRYSEFKATRDIIIHNNGIVNNTYLVKTGDSKRANEGELIPIDKTYFDDFICCALEINAIVYQELLKKYPEL